MSDDRKVVTLNRYETGPNGTFGKISVDDLILESLERPRDIEDHPCIPTGEYDVNWTENVHPKHPFCYEVINVPNRTAILIHSANWFEELLGCIAPGRTMGVIEGDYEGQHINHRGVGGSVAALDALQDKLCRKNFRLIITEGE